MTWFLIALAHADPPIAEEVVVYQDPLAAWDGTRWLIASEHASSAPLVFANAEGVFEVPNWQLLVTTRCDITRRKRVGGLVRCTIERAAFRGATVDRWQRPSDRELVERAFAGLEAQLVGQPVDLRVVGPGDLRLLDQESREGTVVSLLLHTLFDGFQLELAGGWRDGGQWFTTSEPLLTLRHGIESFGLVEAVHHATGYHGLQLVQTIGTAHKQTVVGTTIGPDASPSGRFKADFNVTGMEVPEVPREITVDAGRLQLTSVAIMDRELGVVGERVWSVRGERVRHRAHGHLRRLGDDELPELGRTGQVAPPRVDRPDLPRWRTIAPDAP